MKPVYTLADLRDWESVTADERPAIKLAVIGDPVAHSASPQMHNAALAHLGIEVRYCRLHLKPEEVAPALRLLPEKGFIGINCTIPHKGTVLNAVDEVDLGAQRAGGVNTVRVEADGRLRGFSTDGPGFRRAVLEELDVELSAARVLILGAGGGAGRALAMECVAAEVPKLVLLNRSVEKLAPLTEALSPVFAADRWQAAVWDEARLALALGEVDLVVNCSALGMQAGDFSPIPPELLSSQHLVYDTIYTASRTPLMLAADATGARSANGFSMLLHQGARAFEIWFDRPAPIEVMRGALAKR